MDLTIEIDVNMIVWAGKKIPIEIRGVQEKK